MMNPEVLASAYIDCLKKDEYQLNPGQSGKMKLMNKWVSIFIFNAVNKQFS